MNKRTGGRANTGRKARTLLIADEQLQLDSTKILAQSFTPDEPRFGSVVPEETGSSYAGH